MTKRECQIALRDRLKADLEAADIGWCVYADDFEAYLKLFEKLEKLEKELDGKPVV